MRDIDRLYEDNEGTVGPHRCYDCGRPAFYDYADDHYHHLVDRERGCFLIGAEGTPRAVAAIVQYEDLIRAEDSVDLVASAADPLTIGNQVAVVLALASVLPGGPLTDAEKDECGRHFTALSTMLAHEQRPTEDVA